MALAVNTKVSISAEEARVREDLAAAYRLVALFGWDDLLATHISARVPGPADHFLINPYGLLFEEVTASSLVKIDLDGAIVAPTEYGVNPAGFIIHSAIHAARADAQCVLHLHTIAGTGVSCQAGGLLPLNQTAMLLNERIAYHDFEGIALNPDERVRLVADLGTKNVLILRNHGTLTVGRSVAEAFSWMYFVERACAMQVAAQAGGSQLVMPQPPVQETVARQVAQTDFARFAETMNWPALLRRLERHNPGFRD